MVKKVSKMKSGSEQVVGVELGLKVEENNLDRPFLSDDNHDGIGGTTFNGYKYENNSIISENITSKNNNNNNNNKNSGIKLSDNFGDYGCNTPVLRNLDQFDVHPSYYYPTSTYNNPFFKPSSGGMATAAMGFPFTVAQWKELERQAMIYKYMMASLPVPPDLLYSSPSSAFTPASYFMGKYGSGLSVKWRGNSTDAEPGRCKRTDGKKWRCSRDVAPDSKYCERHMNRGRARSRKHVEHEQLLQQNHQACSLSGLPVVDNNMSKAKDNLTKKTRLNDQSIGSYTVQPLRASAFDQSMVTNANLFEDSRNLAWSDEQQWHHLMQSNMNSSVFQHQLEEEPMNLNSNGGLLEKPLFDAWSMGVTDTKDIGGQSNAVDEEMCQIHMGLGLIDSWVASTTTPGGPLAEVLRPGMASKTAISDTRESDFITPPATAVSSPSGVLQKTLATFSDSSGSTSPVCDNSNTNSDMPFHWLN